MTLASEAACRMMAMIRVCFVGSDRTAAGQRDPPAVVLGVAVGLWTWSWKLFGYALAIGVALTSLTESLMYLLWR